MSDEKDNVMLCKLCGAVLKVHERIICEDCRDEAENG